MMIRELKRRARQVIAPVLSIAVILYLAYHVVQGDRGFLALLQLTRKLEDTKETLKTIEKEHKSLAHRIRLLRPKNIDPDMLNEQARRVLGFVAPDDLLVVQDPPKPKPQKSLPSTPPGAAQ